MFLVNFEFFNRYHGGQHKIVHNGRVLVPFGSLKLVHRPTVVKLPKNIEPSKRINTQMELTRCYGLCAKRGGAGMARRLPNSRSAARSVTRCRYFLDTKSAHDIEIYRRAGLAPVKSGCVAMRAPVRMMQRAV